MSINHPNPLDVYVTCFVAFSWDAAGSMQLVKPGSTHTSHVEKRRNISNAGSDMDCTDVV